MKNIFNNFIWLIKKIFSKTFDRKNRKTGFIRNPYRYYLFEELITVYGDNFFANKRILEIGPKDGEDTLRLDTLNPSEIILNDLEEIKNSSHPINNFYKDFLLPNLEKIKSNYKFVFGNINYLKKEELDNLGKFDLIWFTGIIYHIPEQIRILRKLYNILNIDGVLVLETSTTRNKKLIKQEAIEIANNGSYFFPSRKAIITMLNLVGYKNIVISKCYNKENFNKKNIRLALFATKKSNESDNLHRDKYIFGEAT